MGLLFAAHALAAGGAAPSTAEVLGKLHQSNLTEIRMGEMASAHGNAKDVQAFGKTLVDDHKAADVKVTKLAKEESIDLTAAAPQAGSAEMPPMGPGFDAAFSKDMLEAHKTAIAEVESARAATKDAKLKSLLNQVLPVLKKHEAMAQKLVNQTGKTADNTGAAR